MVTAKAIAEATQHSLMNVVHYIREELNEQLQLRATQAELARQESVRNILIVGGGTASVVAAVFTGGGLWPVTMAMVSGGLSAASTTIPDGASEDRELRGGTAEELLDALVDAVIQTDRNVEDQHDELAESVRDVMLRVENLRGGPDDGDGRLIPIRPDIVDGVDGDNFHLP